jgi:peptide/nickel transport system substrate-binding protein
MNADLIHINRATGKTDPALAKSWTASKDGRTFTVQLRKGIQFSDGAPFDADDVVFSYRVYLDEKVNAPQRGLLMIGDKPLGVEKVGQYSVKFSFPSPYAAAERVFDSISIIPRHLLEKDYADGKLSQAWGLSTSPQQWAGLGPFRLKQAIPGDRIVLERNPHYWKIDGKGQRLPYLEELVYLIVPSRDAQVVRFQAGDTQAIAPLSPENYAALEAEQQARHYRLYDAGPGTEYNFLLLNQNDDTAKLPDVARRQVWFKDLRFRQAMSMGIDRKAMTRLIYRDRATPLVTHVTPGKKQWINPAVRVAEYSPAKARELLKSAGYSWKGDALMDAQGKAVEFTMLASATNALRSQMATLIQSDLKALGINVHVVTLESLSDRPRPELARL